jgi:ketosteroid isomerase-like protein
MSTTFEVGQKLAEFVRQCKYMEAVDALYAPNIVSIEATSMPNMPARQVGIAAIRKKAQWWIDNHTTHKAEVTGPFPHGDRFIVFMRTDVTSKTGPFAGKRMTFDEAGLYTVKDGKIVQEEFFYNMPE